MIRRFVDARAGDDDAEGSAASPWRTLTPVRALLGQPSARPGLEIRLRVGQRWRLGPDPAAPLHRPGLMIRASGAPGAPLVLGAWGPPGSPPLLEGDAAAGILLYDCAHAHIEGLAICGFKANGIVAYAARHVMLRALRVSGNGRRGVHIYTRRDDPLSAPYDVGLRESEISGHTDAAGGSAGANVVLGSRSAFCWIDRCAIFDGMDGIAGGGHGGHLISDNRIFRHRLVRRREGGWDDGNPLDIKHMVDHTPPEARWYAGVDVSGWGSGEPGLTVVRDNEIFENEAALLIHRGTRGVRIEGNHIHHNAARPALGRAVSGIRIAAGQRVGDLSRGGGARAVEVGGIEIRRNRIEDNAGAGIGIHLRGAGRTWGAAARPRWVGSIVGVRIERNQIARNGGCGLEISLGNPGPSVDRSVADWGSFAIRDVQVRGNRFEGNGDVPVHLADLTGRDPKRRGMGFLSGGGLVVDENTYASPGPVIRVRDGRPPGRALSLAQAAAGVELAGGGRVAFERSRDAGGIG